MLFRVKVVFLIQFGLLHYKCLAETVITAPNAFDWNGELDDQLVNELDWKQHPCRRTCKKNGRPMECHYTFQVEAYHTMSKACYDCPFNITDCFRPHCISADGVKRSLVVVNRQMPGPSIEVCQGDRIIVDVQNLLPAESTTMHWHGQHHRSTPYMDGVPYVTQCPIQPGATFRYHYVAATAGTHFWHSHSGFQRGDGVFGPMIVRVPPEKDPHRDFYDYDEHNIVVLDWGHEGGADKFLEHHHADGDNKPPSLLVNGLGRYKELKNKDGEVANAPIATFVVKQNSRYRFRLINAEFLNCPIEISVDNHTMYVVSTDGNDIEPVEAESLVSYAGERFDFIIEMNQEVDNYWIQFRGLMDCDERFKSAYQLAVLRYEGAPETDPNTTVSYQRAPSDTPALKVNALNQGIETNNSVSMPSLEALDDDDDANTKDPDHQFYISYDFYDKNNPHFHRKNLYDFYGVKNVKQRLYTPQLNHISMKLPPFPLLSQRDSIEPSKFCNESSVHGCDEDYCACTHVLQVKLGSVVELILIDKGFTFDANHPFHLHGHAFRVVAMERVGKNVTVEEVRKLDEDGLIRRKLSHAPIKDTVTVPDGGYTVVRFHANNPGYWLFHCHIEFHVELGMALVFKVGEHEDFPAVPQNFPQCGSWLPSGPPEVPVTMGSTSTISTSHSPDPRENEVPNVTMDEKSFTKWLPLIIRELRVTSSASPSSFAALQLAPLAACFLLTSIYR